MSKKFEKHVYQGHSIDVWESGELWFAEIRPGLRQVAPDTFTNLTEPAVLELARQAIDIHRSFCARDYEIDAFR